MSFSKTHKIVQTKNSYSATEDDRTLCVQRMKQTRCEPPLNVAARWSGGVCRRDASRDPLTLPLNPLQNNTYRRL